MIDVSQVDLTEFIANKIQPRVILDLKPGDTWHVLQSSLLVDDCTVSQVRKGEAVSIPLFPYLTLTDSLVDLFLFGGQLFRKVEERLPDRIQNIHVVTSADVERIETDDGFRYRFWLGAAGRE